jgi:hypothetical protein
VDLHEAAPALYDALDSACDHLVRERESVHELCSDPDGSVPALIDQDAIAEIDRVIGQCRAALAKARGEEPPQGREQ